VLRYPTQIFFKFGAVAISLRREAQRLSLIVLKRSIKIEKARRLEKHDTEAVLQGGHHRNFLNVFTM